MRDYFGFVALCCAGLVVFSFFGSLHPAGDSFAVIRVPMVGVGLLACLLAWPRKWLRVVSILGAFVVVVPIFGGRILTPTVSDYDFTLYQQNLSFSGVSQDDWLASMDALAPEMMTLQEVSSRQEPLMQALATSYPTVMRCDFHSLVDVAVLSRFRAIEGSATCAGQDGMAAVQLETPHGPVWLVSIHLHWPWPYGQATQVDRLVAALSALEGHVIIGGDFNAVAWSYTIARIAAASGTTLIGPNAPTFHVRGAPIGIDHVLTGPAFAQQVQVTGKLGSDHHGLVAYLTRTNAP